MKRALLFLVMLVAALTGCASSMEDGDTWHYSYRLEGVPHDQGCTVAQSADPGIVKLEWPAPTDQGWYHPCPDGSGQLCPDLSAPGMFVDVYARGDVDAHSFVELEACK